MARLIIGFERSGVVRDAMRRAGIDAYSCDLARAEDGSRYHIKGNVFDYLDDGWNCGIFHPDCTYLTNSAEWAYKDGPYHQKTKPGTLVGAQRRAARAAALDDVQKLFDAPIKMKAIENPVGAISTIKPCSQYIQPYNFGEDASKKTGLWLEGLPPLIPTKRVEPRFVCCGLVLDIDLLGKYGCPNCCGDNKPLPRWANQTNSGQNNLPPSDKRWMDRARTYPGVSAAMVAQWGPLILNKGGL